MNGKSLMQVPNWVMGRALRDTNNWLPKYNPHNGELLSHFTNSSSEEVYQAVSAAYDAFDAWSKITPVSRGHYLCEITNLMKSRSQEIVECIALETGKSIKDASGEVKAAILQAEYFSGEGMRLYGRSLTSGVTGKYSHTVRQPLGVAGLIVPANTPIANITWKAFPALICGNTVVLKASEDAPHTAYLFAQITKDAGLPDGVLNVIQGQGQVAGAALVQDERVSIISFTGSTSVGKWIAEVGGRRLCRISLELGGKNPFVVCDDADLEQAVHWASLSAFSNAGQRCAAASRIIVFKDIYALFLDKFLSKVSQLKLGVDAESDLGPVINQRSQLSLLNDIKKAQTEQGKVLYGGTLPLQPELSNGYYIQPTVIEGVDPNADLSQKELFGPVVCLYPVENIHEALALANNTQYGLTAAIHTQNTDRAMWFAQHVRAGVANVNLGTFGSEPHMPFGGFGASGNGTREPGVEALDVYSELKNISFLVRQNCL